MARFVETFKDWIVSFPNRYKIIEDGQEKTVEIKRDWEPDVEGTSNNERVMNELVKNITYDTDTVHTTESGTSVYICDLVGMKEFTEYSSSDSSFIPKISAQINTTNSNQLSKIRISGKDGSVSDYDLYTINNGVYSLLGANKLKPNTIVIIKIVSNGANKIAVVQYLMDDKLDKGTYSGNASNLKSEIDKKVSKSGDTMTGTLTISNSKYPEIVFNNLDIAAVGYDVDGKLAYLRSKINTKGLKLHEDDTATLQANNLNTKNKEVVAAINELNDNKLNKSGGTITGKLIISALRYPEVVFDADASAAVGYDNESKVAYLRTAISTGLKIYKDNTATLQANNLNTKNKEVVAAINELNSRGFVKIGECLRVDQSVSIYGYNEFVVCEKYNLNTILDIKYFTKDIVNSLKSFKFISHSRELECEWVFSADGNTITLKDLGYSSDGGIYVYGR